MLRIKQYTIANAIEERTQTKTKNEYVKHKISIINYNKYIVFAKHEIHDTNVIRLKYPCKLQSYMQPYNHAH